jgi:hypothetical protein
MAPVLLHAVRDAVMWWLCGVVENLRDSTFERGDVGFLRRIVACDYPLD